MSNKLGFSLIEAVVAIVIGALVVVAVGGLSERLIHHRATADSNSASMSLAEWQMERLLADPISTPSPSGCTPLAGCPNLCPAPASLTTTSPALCAGTHPAITMQANGTATGPFRVQWTVVDADGSGISPLVIPTPAPAAQQTPMKHITVVVTLPNNPLVNATVARVKCSDGV